MAPVGVRIARGWRARTVRAGDDRGSELIELALVLPILLLVLAGIMDFGFLFQRFEVVTNAAREGARLGSLPLYSLDDAKERAEKYLQAGGLNETHTPPDAIYDTEIVGSVPVAVIRVTVHYPSQFAFLGPIAALVGGSGFGTIQLNATSVMRREGGGS